MHILQPVSVREYSTLGGTSAKTSLGAYNTCGHLCKYCYANANKNLVIENMKKHNEDSPFLIGNYESGDKIAEAKQKSWITYQNEQISFI